jgi:hypothetical protein
MQQSEDWVKAISKPMDAFQRLHPLNYDNPGLEKATYCLNVLRRPTREGKVPTQLYFVCSNLKLMMLQNEWVLDPV